MPVVLNWTLPISVSNFLVLYGAICLELQSCFRNASIATFYLFTVSLSGKCTKHRTKNLSCNSGPCSVSEPFADAVCFFK